MVKAEDLALDIRTRVDAYFEWLLVRGSGRTFPLRKTEIEISCESGQVLFGVFDDAGFGVSPVEALHADELDLLLELGAEPGTEPETIRLIPRTPARELSRNIELARLERANLIGAAIIAAFPTYKLSRIALSAENGRIAQIFVREAFGKEIAVLTDLTATMIHEGVMATAALWSEKLKLRKKPINEVWIVAEKKQARNLRKLQAVFNPGWAARFRIFEVTNDAETPIIKEQKRATPSALWREKPKKLSLPSEVWPSETAAAIMALAPDKTDIIFSKQGETIRFLGLPFARVRSLAGHKRAWFGIDRARRPLIDETWDDLTSLVADLDRYRSGATPNNRHEFYRTSPEAWLESILRRNIKLLDANLILSPIYNQFRTSSDKIDLLAIRRDGRLVIIELKTSPDREMVFQAADYWRKIEIQRRRGELARIRAFGDMEILDRPALIYAVAPALGFHRDFELFAGMLSADIELWRFDLHESWRTDVKVLQRRGGVEGR